MKLRCNQIIKKVSTGLSLEVAGLPCEQLSIIPPSRSDTQKTCSHSLIAANGSSIKTLGTRQMILNLGLQRYSWHFIITDVTQPIIGGDFLCSHSLFVDLINERLIRTDNLKTIKGSLSVHKSFHIASLKSTNEFANMLRDRPEVWSPPFRQIRVPTP